MVYLDCIHVKVRDAGAVRAKAIYLAIGINMEGEKEVLGLWIAQTEGAKFWLCVVTELKNRGVQDHLHCLCRRLKGLSRSHRGGVSKSHGTALYCAYGAQ